MTTELTLNTSYDQFVKWMQDYLCIKHKTRHQNIRGSFTGDNPLDRLLVCRINEGGYVIYRLKFTVEVIGTDTIKVTAIEWDCPDDYLEGLTKAAIERWSRTTQRPSPPLYGTSSDDWFAWYHKIVDELGLKMTLKELATEMGFSYSHIKKLHANYMKENEKMIPE